MRKQTDSSSASIGTAGTPVDSEFARTIDLELKPRLMRNCQSTGTEAGISPPFVNGLPLVVIELKQPGVPARAAFDEKRSRVH